MVLGVVIYVVRWEYHKPAFILGIVVTGMLEMALLGGIAVPLNRYAAGAGIIYW